MHKPSTPSRFTVTRRSALVATGALLAGVGARAQSWRRETSFSACRPPRLPALRCFRGLRGS